MPLKHSRREKVHLAALRPARERWVNSGIRFRELFVDLQAQCAGDETFREFAKELYDIWDEMGNLSRIGAEPRDRYLLRETRKAIKALMKGRFPEFTYDWLDCGTMTFKRALNEWCDIWVSFDDHESRLTGGAFTILLGYGVHESTQAGIWHESMVGQLCGWFGHAGLLCWTLEAVEESMSRVEQFLGWVLPIYEKMLWHWAPHEANSPPTDLTGFGPMDEFTAIEKATSIMEAYSTIARVERAEVRCLPRTRARPAGENIVPEMGDYWFVPFADRKRSRRWFVELPHTGRARVLRWSLDLSSYGQCRVAEGLTPE